MLKATFSCFKGLSTRSERMLWQRGCLGWGTFPQLAPDLLSPRKAHAVTRQIPLAETALKAKMPDFFLNRLKGLPRARTLAEFHRDTAFIDIETTGLNPQDHVTTIAVLRNGELSVFVEGIDLHQFPVTLPDTRMLATYNGTRFDLPFLRAHFGLDLAIPHLDLMHVLTHLGLKGGQKACEKLAGLKRQFSEGQGGDDAVRLWERYKQENDRNALRQLVLYNAEDVIMLEQLAVLACNASMQNYPLPCTIAPRWPREWTPDQLRTSAL